MPLAPYLKSRPQVDGDYETRSIATAQRAGGLAAIQGVSRQFGQIHGIRALSRLFSSIVARVNFLCLSILPVADRYAPVYEALRLPPRIGPPQGRQWESFSLRITLPRLHSSNECTWIFIPFH